MTIRNVPDDVRDELAQRAARSGRSLQEYLRAELVSLAAKPTVDEWLARARADATAHGYVISVEELVADRDAGRR